MIFNLHPYGDDKSKEKYIKDNRLPLLGRRLGAEYYTISTLILKILLIWKEAAPPFQFPIKKENIR